MIRVKALGLHWRGGCLLASEIPDDAGRIKGVRPLGGTVAFGERAEQALLREFREELGIDVTVSGAPLIVENLFTHEGAAGHEILFIHEVRFPDGAFAGQDCIVYQEDNGVTCTARWFDPDQLDQPGTPCLYPTGLRAALGQTSLPRGQDAPRPRPPG